MREGSSVWPFELLAEAHRPLVFSSWLPEVWEFCSNSQGAWLALGVGWGVGVVNGELFLVSPRAGSRRLKGSIGERPGQAPTEPLKLYSNCHVNVHFAGENSHSFQMMP